MKGWNFACQSESVQSNFSLPAKCHLKVKAIAKSQASSVSPRPLCRIGVKLEAWKEFEAELVDAYKQKALKLDEAPS